MIRAFSTGNATSFICASYNGTIVLNWITEERHMRHVVMFRDNMEIEGVPEVFVNRMKV